MLKMWIQGKCFKEKDIAKAHIEMHGP